MPPKSCTGCKKWKHEKEMHSTGFKSICNECHKNAPSCHTDSQEGSILSTTKLTQQQKQEQSPEYQKQLEENRKRRIWAPRRSSAEFSSSSPEPSPWTTMLDSTSESEMFPLGIYKTTEFQKSNNHKAIRDNTSRLGRFDPYRRMIVATREYPMERYLEDGMTDDNGDDVEFEIGKRRSQKKLFPPSKLKKIVQRINNQRKTSSDRGWPRGWRRLQQSDMGPNCYIDNLPPYIPPYIPPYTRPRVYPVDSAAKSIQIPHRLLSILNASGSAQPIRFCFPIFDRVEKARRYKAVCEEMLEVRKQNDKLKEDMFLVKHFYDEKEERCRRNGVKMEEPLEDNGTYMSFVEKNKQLYDYYQKLKRIRDENSPEEATKESELGNDGAKTKKCKNITREVITIRDDDETMSNLEQRIKTEVVESSPRFMFDDLDVKQES